MRMFQFGEDIPKSLIYSCLIRSIQSDSGVGFLNSDQGHPAYLAGAADGKAAHGDSPKDNQLYQLLISLSDYAATSDTPVRNWREFCQLAVEANKKHCRSGPLKSP